MPLQDCARLMRVAAYCDRPEHGRVRVGDGFQEREAGGDDADPEQEGPERTRCAIAGMNQNPPTATIRGRR